MVLRPSLEMYNPSGVVYMGWLRPWVRKASPTAIHINPLWGLASEGVARRLAFGDWPASVQISGVAAKEGTGNMKRYGNLWESVTDFANLDLAARKAQRCKRFRDDVLDYNYDLERNLHDLQASLRDKTYMPGPYRGFVIYEPKRRLISAAPYADRVAHHALCNVIEPIFDRTFVDTCYANRVGKGTHKALARCVELARSHRYVLRADVEKYFPTIDHAILKEKIRRKIKCPDTLWLIELILDNSNEQEAPAAYFPGDDLLTPAERRRGLPIGNLTSQLWANVFLNDMDHLVPGRYGGRRYLRYVDDIALFSDSAEELEKAREALDTELRAIRLRLHPAKTEIAETKRGVNWLGFRILPDRIRVRQENLKRARRRLRQMQADYREGLIERGKISQSIRSWVAHLKHGDTARLRKRIFSSLVFSRN